MNPLSGVVDVIKQIITLAGAFLTITITFSKDIVPAGAAFSRWALALAWTANIVSLIAGIAAMLKVTGLQASGTPDAKAAWDAFLTKAASIQILSFGAGIFILFIIGLAGIFGGGSP